MQDDDDELTQLLKDEYEIDDEVMINYFTPVKILGKGAFCTVISAHDKLSDSQVAIKILSKSGFKKSQVDMLRKESIILNRLNHPNIVRMKMSKETIGKIYLVMEEIKGSSLEDYIAERKHMDDPLQEYEIKEITKQIVKGIKYFHEKNIIHRDLKPENILIQQLDSSDNQDEIGRQFKVKIIDFGLSMQMESQGYQALHDNCGTLLYMAPEAAQKKDYNKSVDMWSLGIVVFIMFTMGKHPFWDSQGESKKSYIEKIKNPLWTFWPDNIDQKACNFITKTATRRSDCRMTAVQCLRHPWLLGEGEISDPITMGDMITTFSNMQGFARLTKSILVLHYLIQKMNTVGSVIKTNVLLQSIQSVKIEAPQRIGLVDSHRPMHSSENGSSDSNLMRGVSNQSISDHDESPKNNDQNLHIIKAHNTPQVVKISSELKSSYAQPISKYRHLVKASPHTNSAGMITRKQSGFSLGVVKKSFDWSKNDFQKMGNQKDGRTMYKSPTSTFSQFDKSPEILINAARSGVNVMNSIDSTTSNNMFLSSVFPSNRRDIKIRGLEKLNSIKSTPIQQKDLKLPQLSSIAQKPPVGRKSIQFLKEDSVISSSSNSQGSNSNKNTHRNTTGVKSFFSKQ